MTDIILQGIYGRMGRTLAEKIAARSDCRVVAGVDREAGQVGAIPVYTDFAQLPCRGVIIDFSAPAGAVAAARYGAENGLPCVICSTGLTAEQEAELKAAGARTAIFRSANMSLGVNVLIELARRATRVLGGEFDIEIVEKHHRNKLDAPSGTALMIADAVLISKAPILLLDEIENAGIFKEAVISHLKGLRKAVIFVTHDPYVSMLSDRRIVMKGGEVVSILSPGDDETEALRKVREMDEEMSVLRERIRVGEVIGSGSF